MRHGLLTLVATLWGAVTASTDGVEFVSGDEIELRGRPPGYSHQAPDMEKLQASDRTEAVSYALKRGAETD